MGAAGPVIVIIVFCSLNTSTIKYFNSQLIKTNFNIRQ